MTQQEFQDIEKQDSIKFTNEHISDEVLSAPVVKVDDEKDRVLVHHIMGYMLVTPEEFEGKYTDE
jgi:hypothetical protein